MASRSPKLPQPGKAASLLFQSGGRSGEPPQFPADRGRGLLCYAVSKGYEKRGEALEIKCFSAHCQRRKSRPQSGIQNQGPATAQPLAALPACGGGVLPLVNGLDLEKTHTGRRRMSSFCWGQKKTWSQNELCDHVEGAVKIDIFSFGTVNRNTIQRPFWAGGANAPQIRSRQRRRRIAQGRLCRPRAFKYRRVKPPSGRRNPKRKARLLSCLSFCVTTTTMDIAALIFVLYHNLTHLHQFSLIVIRIAQLAPFFVFLIRII